MASHSHHNPHLATPHRAWVTLLRWIEMVALLTGMAIVLMSCTSGTSTGSTIGKGVGAWWGSSVSGDESDTARGQAMGAAIGQTIDHRLGRPTPTPYHW